MLISLLVAVGAVVATALLAVLALRTGSRAVCAVPGRVLARLVGGVVRVRRAHVLHALRRAGIEAPDRVADAMYRSLGVGVFELAWAALRGPSRVSDGVTLPPRAVLPPGGAVIATAHTGNWDLVVCAAAARFPLTVVTKRMSVRWLDRPWQGVRRAHGVGLVAAGGVLEAARREFARGGGLVMIVDQAPERVRATVRVSFLGAPADVDLAPALVAQRFGVPLIALFPRRGAGVLHEAVVAGRLDPPATPSRAWAEHAMKTVTAWLEAHVRERPGEWLWMHRRWKLCEASAGASKRGGARRNLRARRSWGAAAAFVASLGTAGTASAEPRTDADGVERDVVHEWYGPSVAATYGIGYAAAALGFAMDGADAAAVRVGAKLVTGAGVITAVLGPPVTHWSFDNLAGGFISLGGQIVVGGAGAFIGGATADRTLSGAGVGLAIGHALWAVADVSLVAHRQRVLSIHAPRPAARPRPSVVPFAHAWRGGGLGGFSVAF